MRNAKRKISLLLILCMFVSMLPASVAADDSEILPGLDGSAADTDAEGTDTSSDGEASAPPDNGADLVPLTADDLSKSTRADVPALTAGTEGGATTWTYDETSKTVTVYSCNSTLTSSIWKENREQVEKIIIEDKVTGIAKETFAECNNLTSIIINNDSDNTTIEPDTFEDCKALTYVKAKGWEFAEGKLSVSAEDVTDSMPWESLKDRVDHVFISADVNTISDNAFAGMSQLKDDDRYRAPVVEYEGKYETWVGGTRGLRADLNGKERYLLVSCKGDGALIGECGPDTTFVFDGAGALTITGEEISNYTEYHAPWASIQSRVTKLDMGNVETIGARAFYSLTNLKQVTISANVTEIGESAFAHCTGLENLDIVEGVDGTSLSIGAYAFYDCTSLKNIGGAIDATSNLPAAGIPKRVTKIGQAAFRSSGLVYKGNDTGHIYYAGNRSEWEAIRDRGGSPDIRDGKLLTGPTSDNEDIYAVVHFMDADSPALYHVLTFTGGTGASGTLPEVAENKIAIVKKIVSSAIKDGKVAEDTTFKLPAANGLIRDGYTFDGWKCSADGKTCAADSEFTMPPEDVTFTAQWKRNEPVKGDPIQETIEYLESGVWEVQQQDACTRPELVPILDAYPDGMVAKRLEDAKALPNIDLSNTTISYRIQVKSFREAQMGIANMTKGLNGAFEFEIYLNFKDSSKKVTSATAHIKNGIIIATEYNAGTTDKTYQITYNLDYPNSPEPPKQDPLLPGQTFVLPRLDRTEGTSTYVLTGWECTTKVDNQVKTFTYRPNATYTMRASDVEFKAVWKEITSAGNNNAGGTNTASLAAEQGTPELMVSKQSMEALVRSDLADGKKASVVLSAAPVPEGNSSAQKLREALPEDQLTLIDLNLIKTVDGESSMINDTKDDLLTINVKLPADVKDENTVNVYREHEGEIHDLSSKDEREDNDWFEVKSGSVIIHASKFSVYAIAYDRKSSGTGGDSTSGNTGSDGSTGGNPSTGSSSNTGTSTSTGSSTSTGTSTGTGGGTSSGGGRSKPNIARKDKDTTTPPTTPSTTPADTPTAKKQFNDVPPTAWYYEAATWAYDAKIAKGEGGKRLNPNKLCTRAEMVTFLWRALGCPEPSGTGKTFVDVASGSWYAKAVQWAAGQKIVKGEGGKRFNPDATISRAEAVTFLYRTLGVPTALGSRFTDVPESAYYAEAVAWAAEKDIAQGLGKRSFSPAGPCTRAQVLTFLYRSKS